MTNTPSGTNAPPGNPFQPASRSNPNGFRTREFTVSIEVEVEPYHPEMALEDGDEEGMEIEDSVSDAAEDAAEDVAESEDVPSDGAVAAGAAPMPLRIAISSEAAVERMDWMTGELYLEVLDHGESGPNLEYVRDGLPFLLDHDLGQQIGLGTPPTLGRDRLLRTEVQPGNHPDASWVFADMRQGIRRKVSIGYWPGETYNETRRADGMKIRRYRGWQLFEASSVAVPADYAVGIGRSGRGAGMDNGMTEDTGDKGNKPKKPQGRPITDFPQAGGDAAVSLDNSQYDVFPLDEAKALQNDYPSVWAAGGNIRGNQQFRLLAPVAEHGGEPRTPSEEEAVRLREAWAARHEGDFRLPGVVAQVKWLVVGNRGLEYMREVLKAATDAVDAEDERKGRAVMTRSGAASGRASISAQIPAAAGQAHTMERQMDNGHASAQGSAPVANTRAEARSQELATLARNFPAHARLADWIAEGITVDTARDEVMRKLATAADTASKVTATPGIDVGQDREASKPWGSNVEFLRAVRAASTGVGTDKRLTSERAASGMGVQIGADGGFLVPEQFATGIVKYAFETGQVLSRVNRIPVTGNQYHMNLVDETSRTTGNRWGGIRGYWVGEGDTITTSKARIRRATLDVTKKLAVAAYVSSEALEDAAATSTILDQAFGEEVAFMTEQAIFEGSGAGQPLGILSSNALVTVAKESSQSTASVVAANVVKMRARLTPRSRANAVFYVHLDVEPELATMTIGNQPVYLPPGGLAGNPLGQLLGIPVIPIEHCPALGTTGDILLADMSWYALGEKATSAMARSMHVRFLNDEETFRLTYRVDGFPMLQSPITPNKGSNTLSAFVALATRP